MFHSLITIQCKYDFLIKGKTSIENADIMKIHIFKEKAWTSFCPDLANIKTECITSLYKMLLQQAIFTFDYN